MARRLYLFRPVMTLFLLASTTMAEHTASEPSGSPDDLESKWYEACDSSGEKIISVEEGMLSHGSVTFKGAACTNKDRITFQINGKHQAPDYTVMGSCDAWITFQDVNSVSISGTGILDANGESLWACKKSGGGDHCPEGATSLSILNSKDVEIEGITLLNSQKFHMAIVGTTTAMIQGVTITADGESPNTDGIHVESSSAVNITHSNVGTGDDCVSIGPRTNGVTIRNLTCGPGHGVSIGSLGREDNEGRVENILVEYVQFTETQNGARIKAVARPEADAVVNQVVFQHLTMTDVTNPVLIDQYYCPDHQNCPQGDSGVKIGDVKFVDIQGSSKSEFAVNLNCSALSKCSDITVSDVELTYNGGKPRASCNNLVGNPCDSVFPSN